MEELAGSFDSRMREYESNLKKLSATDNTQVPHKDLAALSREFTDFRSIMWKTLGSMRVQLELLVQGMDRQETATRRKVLMFHGITESSDSSVEDSIVTILHDHFKMTDISPKLFVACHRLGSNISKPRPVLVRFLSYDVRSAVWNAKTALKGSGITVSEFLTKPRHEVFVAARKHFGLRKCWTSEGKIVVLLPDNKRRRIETMSELRPLLSEHPAVVSDAENSTPGTSQGKVKTPSRPAVAAVRAGKPESRTRRALK